MELASHIWVVADDSAATESVMPMVHTDDVDASIVVAKAFQRKAKPDHFLQQTMINNHR